MESSHTFGSLLIFSASSTCPWHIPFVSPSNKFSWHFPTLCFPLIIPHVVCVACITFWLNQWRANAWILLSSDKILSNQLPASQIEIDDAWTEQYGDLDFDPVRFPDPQKMVADLNSKGLGVSLWTHPSWAWSHSPLSMQWKTSLLSCLGWVSTLTCYTKATNNQLKKKVIGAGVHSDMLHNSNKQPVKKKVIGVGVHSDTQKQQTTSQKRKW